MTKIATSVLAGFRLTKRLVELQTPEDRELKTQIDTLAESLGETMAAVEACDKALLIVALALQVGDIEVAKEGVDALRSATAQLLSDQDKIEQELGFSQEQMDLMKLLAEITKTPKTTVH